MGAHVAMGVHVPMWPPLLVSGREEEPAGAHPGPGKPTKTANTTTHNKKATTKSPRVACPGAAQVTEPTPMAATPCACGLLFLFAQEKKSQPEHTQVLENQQKPTQPTKHNEKPTKTRWRSSSA